MIFKDIWLDIKAVQERDPAARSALEVLLLMERLMVNKDMDGHVAVKSISWNY